MKTIKVFLLIVLSDFVAGNFSFAQTWTQTSAPSNVWISVASSADGNKLVAAQGGIFGPGSIYISTNSGVEWIKTSAPTNYWNAIASSADGMKLAAVTFGQINNEYGGGLIYVSTNSGATWIAADAPTNNWTGIASSANGNKLAAASGSSIYVSVDSGAIWTETSAPTNGWYSIASSADGNKLVAAGTGGTNGIPIYTSTNSGITWGKAASLFAGPSVSIAASANCGKLIVVSPTVRNFGGFFVSTNFGVTWTTNDTFGGWTSVASSSTGDKMAAVTGNGYIYISIDSGITWTLSTNLGPTVDLVSIASSADGSKLATVNNEGGIWTYQTVPTSLINVRSTNNDIILSWVVPSTNLVLQQSSDLSNWIDLTNTPVLNFTNLQNEIILPLANGNNFYRLKTP